MMTTRRRLLTALAAVAFCAAFTVIVYRVARTRPAAAAPSIPAEIDPRDRAEVAAYAATLELAMRAIDAGDPVAAREHLDACPWHLRGWEYRHVEARIRPALTLRGHEGTITAVAYSRDGTRVVTGGRDKTARVWDARTGAELLAVPGHDEQVRAVAWHPSGTTFATAGGTVATIRDAETGRPLHTLAGHPSAVACLAFSADGRRLLVGLADGGEARVYDGDSGKLHRVLRQERGLRFPALDPSGTRIASCLDGTLSVIDADTGRVLVTAPVGDAYRVTFRGDGERLLATGLESARFLDARTGRATASFAKDSRNAVAAEFAPDGQSVGFGEYDSVLRFRDAVTGDPTRPPVPFGDVFAFAPDGSRVAVGGGGPVEVYDLRGDGPTRTFRDVIPGRTWRTLDADEMVFAVKFSPDGRHILSANYGNAAKVRDAVTGRVRAVMPVAKPIRAAAYSPDGSLVATGSDDAVVRLWNPATGAEAKNLEPSNDHSHSVFFSADGSRLYAAGDDLHRWDVGTGKRTTLARHGRKVEAALAAPDAKHVLARLRHADDSTREWALLDADDGTPVAAPHWLDPKATVMSVSPDGGRVAVGGTDGMVRLFGTKTPGPAVVLSERLRGGTMFAWGPGGSRLATADIYGYVRVFDARTGERVARLREYGSVVGGVAFSPDGEHIAVGSYEKTLVWSAPPPSPRRVEASNHRVAAVAFSADGSRLFAWDDYDGRTCYAWDARTGRPVPAADPPAKPAPGPAVSPDGRLRAEVCGAIVEVADVPRR